jgi:hypothetical protein
VLQATTRSADRPERSSSAASFKVRSSGGTPSVRQVLRPAEVVAERRRSVGLLWCSHNSLSGQQTEGGCRREAGRETAPAGRFLDQAPSRAAIPGDPLVRASQHRWFVRQPPRVAGQGRQPSEIRVPRQNRAGGETSGTVAHCVS